MKVVEPRDAILLSTNVPANSETVWSSSATYGQGDRVQVTSVTPHKVYESLRANNVNRPPADNLEPVQETGTSSTSREVGTGSKSFTTQTGLSFSAGMVVEIAKTVTPKTVNMTAEVTSYNSSTGALTVSVYSKSGEGTHSGWTITSEDEIGFWKEIGATNQYAMLDEYLNTKTSNLEEITASFSIEKTDYISFFGLSGATVDLELWDSSETTLLWSETIDLVYGSASIANISDWWEYFFGEQTVREDAVADVGFTVYEGVLKVTISADNGNDAECGNILTGRVFDIGKDQYDANAGIIDYSDIEEDEDGNTKVEQGAWSKHNVVYLYIPSYNLDNVYRLLSTLRGVPTAWIAMDGSYETYVVYGLYRDFSIIFSNELRSYCELEIKGLI